MGILFTTHKLPSLHSESVSRSMSKASTYSYAGKNKTFPQLPNTAENNSPSRNLYAIVHNIMTKSKYSIDTVSLKFLRVLHLLSLNREP